MDFGQIVEGTRQGRSGRRKGWNGKGMYIFDFKHSFVKYPKNEDFSEEIYDMVEYGDDIEIGAFDSEETYKIDNFLLLKTAGGTCIPWNASQADMFADDWEFVD
jgi:hypothetical protein